MVDGSHRMEVPLGSDRCIDPAWVDSHAWTPVDLQSGTWATSGRRPRVESANDGAACNRRHPRVWVVPGPP